MLSTADRSFLYDKSSPYKWLLELVCDLTSAAGGAALCPYQGCGVQDFKAASTVPLPRFCFHQYVVISLASIPPTSAEAPDPADRFRYRFLFPEQENEGELVTQVESEFLHEGKTLQFLSNLQYAGHCTKIAKMIKFFHKSSQNHINFQKNWSLF